jgi:hypothetical protein
MPQAVVLAAALLARGVAVLALTYSDWLFEVLLEGAQAGYCVLTDLWQYIDYLRASLTKQFIGYPSGY